MPGRRFAVEVPEFDPEVDALYLTVGGFEYTLVLDFAVIYEMDKRGMIGTDGQFDFDMDALVDVIVLCAQRNHPDVTKDQVMGWLATPKSISTILPAFQEYMQEVLGSLGGDEPGEEVTARG